MEYEFSDHVIRRIMNRYQMIITYYELQQFFASHKVRPSYGRDVEVVVKRFDRQVRVPGDGESINEELCGTQLVALCEATRDGIVVKTISLRR